MPTPHHTTTKETRGLQWMLRWTKALFNCSPNTSKTQTIQQTNRTSGQEKWNIDKWIGNKDKQFLEKLHHHRRTKTMPIKIQDMPIYGKFKEKPLL